MTETTTTSSGYTDTTNTARKLETKAIVGIQEEQRNEQKKTKNKAECMRT